MEKCFSWKLAVNIVKTDVFDTLVRKPHKEIFSMASFSTEGIGLNGHMGSTFSKKVGFWKVEIQKNVENCAKMGWNGFRKMIGGSQEVRKGQNCAANPLEGFPDLQNPFKNSKKVKNPKDPENQQKSVFFLGCLFFRCGRLRGVGGTAQPFN